MSVGAKVWVAFMIVTRALGRMLGRFLGSSARDAVLICCAELWPDARGSSVADGAERIGCFADGIASGGAAANGALVRTGADGDERANMSS